MKCIVCDEEGEYLFHGCSFCMPCLLKHYKNYFPISASAFSNPKALEELRAENHAKQG